MSKSCSSRKATDKRHTKTVHLQLLNTKSELKVFKNDSITKIHLTFSALSTVLLFKWYICTPLLSPFHVAPPSLFMFFFFELLSSVKRMNIHFLCLIGSSYFLDDQQAVWTNGRIPNSTPSNKWACDWPKLPSRTTISHPSAVIITTDGLVSSQMIPITICCWMCYKGVISVWATMIP